MSFKKIRINQATIFTPDSDISMYNLRGWEILQYHFLRQKYAILNGHLSKYKTEFSVKGIQNTLGEFFFQQVFLISELSFPHNHEI